MDFLTNREASYKQNGWIGFEIPTLKSGIFWNVQSGRSLLTFRRNEMSTTSGSKNKIMLASFLAYSSTSVLKMEAVRFQTSLIFSYTTQLTFQERILEVFRMNADGCKHTSISIPLTFYYSVPLIIYSYCRMKIQKIVSSRIICSSTCIPFRQ
jgi:hypothetical protein